VSPAETPGAPLALAVQSLGEGPALVVLHGLFGSGTNWRTIARRLAHEHRVLLVDLRNHGASPHAATMGYAEMAADVRALLDREGLDAPLVLGHSMGGKTAMRLALETPSRVGALVVVDIAPARSPGEHRGVLGALAALDLGGLRRRSEADAALAPAIPDPGLRQFLLQSLAAGEHGLQWRLNLPAITAAQDELVDFPPPPPGARYPGPVLFVHGERSEYLTPGHREAVRALFPEAHLVGVPDAGHWVHAEQPDAFLEALRPFLAEVRGG
jgi:esterase